LESVPDRLLDWLSRSAVSCEADRFLVRTGSQFRNGGNPARGYRGDAIFWRIDSKLGNSHPIFSIVTKSRATVRQRKIHSFRACCRRHRNLAVNSALRLLSPAAKRQEINPMELVCFYGHAHAFIRSKRRIEHGFGSFERRFVIVAKRNRQQSELALRFQ
jgi:hypothetical protein